MNKLYPELKDYLDTMTEPNYPAKFECAVEVCFLFFFFLLMFQNYIRIFQQFLYF